MSDICTEMLEEFRKADQELRHAEAASTGPLDTRVLFAAIHLEVVAQYLMMYCSEVSRALLIKRRLHAVSMRLKWEQAIDARP